MSATVSSTVRPAATIRPGALSRLLISCWHGIKTYRARRAAIDRLHALDDWQLRDIGLTRFQIEAAVHGRITRSDLRRNATPRR
jgi:uncharacterized protein YjiS (DUF1127 family)